MIFLIVIKYKLLARINIKDHFILRKDMNKKEILINMRNIFQEIIKENYLMDM